MKIRPTRFFGPLLATKRSGMVRAMCCTIALEKLLDRVPVLLRRERHHHVQALAAAGLEEGGEAQLVEERPDQLGASWICCQSTPSPGSRSKIMRSGCVDVARRRVPGVQLDHVHLRRADAAPSASRSRASAGARARSPVELLDAGDLRPCRRASGRTARRRCRPGARTSATGRPARCGSISVATAS